MTTILNIIFVLGLAAVACGAGMIFLPAGLIVGGVLAAATVVLIARGEIRATTPGGDA